MQSAGLSTVARCGRLPELLRCLFPGYELESLSLPRDSDLVMLHVLTRGGKEHLRWLVRRFGDAAIRRWILKHRGRGLTIKQMSAWVPQRTAARWLADNPYARLWEHR